MPTALTSSTIVVVKATVPTLTTHGMAIAAEMYSRLFRNESIRSLFNQANQGKNGAQVAALATAILGYARNIEHLDALSPLIERVAHKHVGFDILPEHYPFVAEALIGAIVEVLGPDATPEVLAAWGEAYWFLAEVLMSRERELRGGLTASEGGWVGWRDFVVAEKKPESALITSFLLKPVDQDKVILHRPGQYLTFTLCPTDQAPMKRNYSISSGPNTQSYRISVKREVAGQGGSRYLHDHVGEGAVLQVGPPSGNFFLPQDQARPVILLSAGVGLTPFISMLEAIASQHRRVAVHYVHGAVSGELHAMRDRVSAVTRQVPGISTSIFYSAPEAGDIPSGTYDYQGRITAEWLRINKPILDADIYLCGPRPFLKDLISGLSQAGVPADRLHYEFFGPANELISA